MSKFKVYFECNQDPYIIVEAEDQEEARIMAEELYDDSDFEIFTNDVFPEISKQYSGYFKSSDVEELP
jgi:hypothetical protein